MSNITYPLYSQKSNHFRLEIERETLNETLLTTLRQWVSLLAWAHANPRKEWALSEAPPLVPPACASWHVLCRSKWLGGTPQAPFWCRAAVEVQSTTDPLNRRIFTFEVADRRQILLHWQIYFVLTNVDSPNDEIFLFGHFLLTHYFLEGFAD